MCATWPDFSFFLFTPLFHLHTLYAANEIYCSFKLCSQPLPSTITSRASNRGKTFLINLHKVCYFRAGSFFIHVSILECSTFYIRDLICLLCHCNSNAQFSREMQIGSKNMLSAEKTIRFTVKVLFCSSFH